ncbi:MAG: ribonuclease R [Chlorobi bacterium]|nr:ribonuclease R [Chlorobiota bacterium]
MPDKFEKLLIRVLQIMSAEPRKSFNYKQLAAMLELRSDELKQWLRRELERLADEDKLEETSKGKYRIKPKTLFIGVLDMTNNGTGFVVTDELEKDIFIPNRYLNKALHGDLVEARILRDRPGRNPEGEIVRIIERAKTRFTGIVRMLQGFAFVDPDDPKMYKSFYVDEDHLNGAGDGDKVVVEMTDWPEKAGSPFGRVIKVLGKPGEHETEIHAILDEYNLPYEFDPEVEMAAQKLPAAITRDEIARRRDMRDRITFTIDPVDAKDFDDALSVRKLDNGRWEIGVHIADVTHYVRPGDVIDREAYERSTSVYLVDRVIPMLPEVLSNQLCSLRPNEDKLTFSVVFEMDENGKVYKRWFGRTVIHSDKRFTYEEAQKILDDGKGLFHEQLDVLNRMAKKLRAARFRKGAISFERSEVRFRLDEDKNPVEIYVKIPIDTNKLIEEFMLLANRHVAEFVGKEKKGKVFVYRVHDKPKKDRLDELRKVIKKFGYRLRADNDRSLARAINKLLEDVRDKKERTLVELMVLRTMSKAVYTTDNRGHYGLAFDYYTHFTSPIRRYPDMMVHRLLQQYLDGKQPRNKQAYEKKCIHTTDMEINAQHAEWDSIAYMQAKYISEYIGEEFDGVISGVTEWGIYVELVDTLIEGMVRRTEMINDYFIYDPDEQAMVGQRTGKRYTLGDDIRVRVAGVNLEKKQVSFMMADDFSKRNGTRKKKKKKKSKKNKSRNTKR